MYAQVGGDRAEGLLDGPDILGLGVERGVVDTAVVNAILLLSGKVLAALGPFNVGEGHGDIPHHR